MTNTNNEIIEFKTGETYETRSICDSDCIYSFEILRRTAKCVWVKVHGEVVRRKITVYDGVEEFSPFGKYSMSATIRANKGVIEIKHEDNNTAINTEDASEWEGPEVETILCDYDKDKEIEEKTNQAEEIKKDMLKRFGFCFGEIEKEFFEYLNNQDDSQWWIDNKHLSLYELKDMFEGKEKETTNKADNIDHDAFLYESDEIEEIEEIEVDNKKFKKNEIVNAIGLDMQCREIITSAKFIEYCEHNIFDCVIECDDGIKTYAKSSELSKIIS